MEAAGARVHAAGGDGRGRRWRRRQMELGFARPEMATEAAGARVRVAEGDRGGWS
jgi:hypothetical protein